APIPAAANPPQTAGKLLSPVAIYAMYRKIANIFWWKGRKFGFLRGLFPFYQRVFAPAAKTPKIQTK
ncbi:MAG: hypothetical protein JJT94_07440, partial [Bernardetiaceae bacterium]|nr:hypothetical protein [Bernardetiaceae bacterium]